MTRLLDEVRRLYGVALERDVHERQARSAGGGDPVAPVPLGDQVADALLPHVVEDEGDLRVVRRHHARHGRHEDRLQSSTSPTRCWSVGAGTSLSSSRSAVLPSATAHHRSVRRACRRAVDARRQLRMLAGNERIAGHPDDWRTFRNSGSDCCQRDVSGQRATTHSRTPD
jgi:hypothetical protein